MCIFFNKLIIGLLVLDLLVGAYLSLEHLSLDLLLRTELYHVLLIIKIDYIAYHKVVLITFNTEQIVFEGPKLFI